MLRSAPLKFFTLAIALGWAASASAEVVVPFTEDFTAGTSDWRDANSAVPTHVADGGPNGPGDAFISFNKQFATANPETIFRGQDNFNSSNDAFVDNWIAEGVEEFSFWLRHNSSASLTVGTRFATSANFPGFGYLDPVAVPPNVWTKIVIDISPSNPLFVPEGPVAFATVFGALGNIQIVGLQGAGPATVTFDLDKVSVVPEPSGVVLAIIGAGSVCLAYGLRRRQIVAAA